MDQSFFDYLLNNKNLGRELRVSVQLGSKESYDLFLDLLQAMEEKQTFITFDRIDWFYGETQLAKMKWILESMDALGISK